jgi:uncharacterized protein YggU (UPF0235/DUF167 family)
MNRDSKGETVPLIRIEVKTRSAKTGVERVGPERFRVRVASAPVKGAANREAIKLMAEFLGLPPSALRIVRGRGSPRKVVAVFRPDA